jgi:hypothetical protein
MDTGRIAENTCNTTKHFFGNIRVNRRSGAVIKIYFTHFNLLSCPAHLPVILQDELEKHQHKA